MRKHLLLFLSLLFISAALSAQWSTQASGFATSNRGINQIVIVNKDVVWATAYDGSGSGAIIQEYTRTTDGGQTWIQGNVSTAPTTYDWSCLAAVSADSAWALFWDNAAGATGGLYQTVDGGVNWVQQGVGTMFVDAASFPDIIYFWDSNNGVVIGDPINGEYEMYTTIDGGNNWIPVPGANIPNPTSGEFTYTRVLSVRGDIMWFSTNKGRVFKSTDHGYNWTVATTGLTNTEYIEFKDANTGWVKLTNTLKRSTDGGATWNTVAPSGTFFKGNLAYVPTTQGTIISTGSNFQTGDYGSSYSLDDGDTWLTIDSAIQHLAVAFWDYNTGWSGGFNVDQFTDGMFTYNGTFDSTITSVGNSPFYQINLYPNPSNGLFYISFDADNNNPVDILVTDVMGNAVFRKRYSDPSQLWLRSIDLRKFSNGIYFLHLSNASNEGVRKLIKN